MLPQVFKTMPTHTHCYRRRCFDNILFWFYTERDCSINSRRNITQLRLFVGAQHVQRAWYLHNNICPPYYSRCRSLCMLVDGAFHIHFPAMRERSAFPCANISSVQSHNPNSEPTTLTSLRQTSCCGNVRLHGTFDGNMINNDKQKNNKKQRS